MGFGVPTTSDECRLSLLTSAIRSSHLLMINTWDQPYGAPPNFVKIGGAHCMTLRWLLASSPALGKLVIS
jgi:hypothetical protein